MANKVKLYQIRGYYIKERNKFPLYVECKASKIEDALEKAYSDVGSRHKVKRDRIFIEKKTGIKEIDLSEARNPEFEDLQKADFEIQK